jgi:hypothetical protein
MCCKLATFRATLASVEKSPEIGLPTKSYVQLEHNSIAHTQTCCRVKGLWEVYNTALHLFYFLLIHDV